MFFIYRTLPNRDCLPTDIQAKLDSQINIVSHGINGENNVAYELKNSGMAMYVLQDIYVEHDGLSAQIDFLVITRKGIFVIECKNLYGNILINDRGDFIRTGGSKKDVGIYSPVEQNRKHMNVIKQLRFEEKSRLTSKISFETNFRNIYRSVIVIANEKTILNDIHAPTDVKALVTRSDSLIRYITHVNEQINISESSDKEMEMLARFFYEAHVERDIDYAADYRIKTLPPDDRMCPDCGRKMVQRTAKKGSNAGTQFWGCSGYPECKTTMV